MKLLLPPAFIKYVCSAECILDYPKDVIKKNKNQKNKNQDLGTWKLVLRKAEKFLHFGIDDLCAKSYYLFHENKWYNYKQL